MLVTDLLSADRLAVDLRHAGLNWCLPHLAGIELLLQVVRTQLGCDRLRRQDDPVEREGGQRQDCGRLTRFETEFPVRVSRHVEQICSAGVCLP